MTHHLSTTQLCEMAKIVPERDSKLAYPLCHTRSTVVGRSQGSYAERLCPDDTCCKTPHIVSNTQTIRVITIRLLGWSEAVIMVHQ